MKKNPCLTLDNEFIEYCKINNINKPEEYAKIVFNRGFTIIKYGETPFTVPVYVGEKEIIKEVVIKDEVEVNKLKDELVKVNSELESLKSVLGKLPSKGTHLKNSNLNSLYDE